MTTSRRSFLKQLAGMFGAASALDINKLESILVQKVGPVEEFTEWYIAERIPFQHESYGLGFKVTKQMLEDGSMYGENISIMEKMEDAFVRENGRGFDKVVGLKHKNGRETIIGEVTQGGNQSSVLFRLEDLEEDKYFYHISQRQTINDYDNTSIQM